MTTLTSDDAAPDALHWCPRCGEPAACQIDQPVCEGCEEELDREAEHASEKHNRERDEAIREDTTERVRR